MQADATTPLMAPQAKQAALMEENEKLSAENQTLKEQLRVFEARAGGPSNRPHQSSRQLAGRGSLSASGPAGNLDTIPPEVRG